MPTGDGKFLKATVWIEDEIVEELPLSQYLIEKMVDNNE